MKLSIVALALIFTNLGCIGKGSSDTVKGGLKDVDAIAYVGITKINTKACTPFQVRLLNENGQVINATEDITIQITTTGAAKIFSDETCETINHNATVVKDDFRANAFMQSPNLETFSLQYDGTAFVSIEVTKFSTGYLEGAGLNGLVRAIEESLDDKATLYIGGGFNSYHNKAFGKMARLNIDGSPDLTFDFEEGFFNEANPSANDVYDIISDVVHVYAGGQMNYYLGQNNFSIKTSRFNANGTRDESFNPINIVSQGVRKIKKVSNNIWMAGCFHSANAINTDAGYSGRIFTLSTNGSIDFAFDTENQIANAVGETPQIGICINDFDILENGKVIIVGDFRSFGNAMDFEPYSGIMRLNADGSLDETFVVGDGISGSTAIAYAMVRDQNDKIYVGGTFTQYNGTASNRIVRLNANGTLDNNFSIGAGFNDGAVHTLALTPNGKIYVGGTFTQYQGQGANRIIRLNEDGSRDNSFTMGDGFDGSVHTIKVAQDASGDVWVGGEFDTYQNQNHPYLIRLDDEGNID